MPTPQEFWDTLPHCSGFHGGCDGDLVGEHHIESCPLYGREEMSWFEFSAAYHAHASAEERRRRQAGKTHWPGCWKDHLDCAVENVQRLVKAATEVERISSRDHNAWAELRSALDALKEGK